MSTKLRIGLIGCGSFAHRLAQTLQQLDGDVEMVAFCNRTVAKAEAFAAEYGGGTGNVFGHHREMFANVPLDAVVITLPPFAHSDEVEMAAARGVHVFIEKPIALSSADGWRMVDEAEAAGITTQVGFMYRFGAAVEALKGLIDDGSAGPVGLMAARYFCNSLHTDWWRDREKSGGQLVEQVIHMVDLMRYLVGDPVTAYSRQSNMFHQETPGYTVEDVSATVYGFPTGAVGVIYASNGAIPGRWINDYRLVARRITAEFQDANHATFAHTAEPERPPTVIAEERDVYLAEMRDFISAIRSGGPTRTPLREGAKSLDMALAATESAMAQREVGLG